MGQLVSPQVSSKVVEYSGPWYLAIPSHQLCTLERMLEYDLHVTSCHHVLSSMLPLLPLVPFAS